VPTEEEPQDPWSPPAYQRKRSRLWIVLLVGAVLFVSLTCLGGSALVFFGLDLVTADVAADLRDNAVLREELGDIRSFEIAWGKSFAHPDEDVFVYRVTGTKGSGLVQAESITVDEGEHVIWAELLLPSGEVRVLVEREGESGDG
jgi:hypothetical protein